MIGPNGVRLLNEMLETYPIPPHSKVMDLGCGKGLTSLFLAQESKANVFAADLWVSATNLFYLLETTRH
ncbi:MAG: methyltransferase [Subdoligranulum sp.]|nr:methyltransferase [Subdoligranulum sp.]